MTPETVLWAFPIVSSKIVKQAAGNNGLEMME
jgi:hypothetical protein